MDEVTHESIMAPTARAYSPRGTFFCSYDGCSATFPRLDRLAHHERTHTGERPFMCVLDDCKKSYTRREHLKRHIAVCHKSETKGNPAQCASCEKNFKTKDSLKKHIQRFHGEAVIECEICKKKFLKRHKLKEHLFDHSGVKPFKCTHDGCSKEFVVLANLKRHQKSHDGYQCDQKGGCSEVFATWSLLRKHKAEKHTPVPTCEKCGRKFSCRSNLKVHLPSHDDLRLSFHCTYDDCPRYYFFKKNLAHHISSYHHDKKHPCPFENCGQNFINQTKLKNHIRLHEAKDSSPKKKKNRKKAQKRKERVKALPRKAMACILSGHEIPNEEEMKLIQGLDKGSKLMENKVTDDVSSVTNISSAETENNGEIEKNCNCPRVSLNLASTEQQVTTENTAIKFDACVPASIDMDDTHYFENYGNTCDVIVSSMEETTGNTLEIRMQEQNKRDDLARSKASADIATVMDALLVEVSTNLATDSDNNICASEVSNLTEPYEATGVMCGVTKFNKVGGDLLKNELNIDDVITIDADEALPVLG